MCIFGQNSGEAPLTYIGETDDLAVGKDALEGQKKQQPRSVDLIRELLLYMFAGTRPWLQVRVCDLVNKGICEALLYVPVKTVCPD